MRMVKVVTTTCAFVRENIDSHQSQIKVVVIVAPGSGNRGTIMGLHISRSFDVISTYAWPNSKCTRMVKVITPIRLTVCAVF